MTAADTCPRCGHCVRRFWASVDKSADCWIWTGKLNSVGYGQFFASHPKRGHRLTHRYAYEATKGPIPPGFVLDHLCRNKLCVNPEHLEPVTPRENTLRGLRGRLQTHCVNGHEFTAENTYIHYRRGTNFPHRQCRICRREADRRRKSGGRRATEQRQAQREEEAA